MTIVVTGATGFIGSEVIKALSRLGERTLAVSGPRSTQLVKYHNVEWLAYDSDLEDLTRRVAQVSPTAVVH